MWVSELEFNVPFQHKHGYIRDDWYDVRVWWLSALDYEHQESSESVAASRRGADDCRLAFGRQTKTAKDQSHVVSVQLVFIKIAEAEAVSPEESY